MSIYMKIDKYKNIFHAFPINIMQRIVIVKG